MFARGPFRSSTISRVTVQPSPANRKRDHGQVWVELFENVSLRRHDLTRPVAGEIILQGLSVERKLTAILCADVHGYSRLMGENEEATVRTLSAHRRIINGLIEQHHGRFVNSAGDSVLAEFGSVVNAVECAVEIQATLKAENASLPPERQMEFRIGVNLGDVVVDGEQIYGDGINVAARLESLAEPGGIYISGKVREEIRNKLALKCEDLGALRVKNIVEPVRVFRVLPEGGTTTRRKTQRVQRKYVRRGAFSMAGLAIIAVAVVLVQHISLKPQHTSASIPPAQSPALPLPDKPSIAVLPFTNISGDHEQEYFSDGITDDLITDLSRLQGLFVIARTSSFTYKDKPAKLQEVGKELGVKYVLEGSIRKAGEQVRITVQLADATTGAELWAERYDRPLRDVFAVQDEIVRRIVTTLNLQLNLTQQGIVIPRSTENLEAYDDLLRGAEYLVSLTNDDNTKARQMFEKAIQLDPKYAMAYAYLGENYLVGWSLAFNPNPDAPERALQMEQQAIALDDSLSDAHSDLAAIYAGRGQYNRALTEAQRGIALDPNSASGYFWLADVLNLMGRPAEALVAADKAMRLDPRSAENYSFEQGYSYTRLGQWTEAIPTLKHYSRRFPHDLWCHVWLADDYAGLGDTKAAQAEVAQVERAVALEPSAVGYVALAEVMNATGRPAEALAAAEKAIHLDPHNYIPLRQEGWADTQLGRWEEAVSVLKRFLARFPDSPYGHGELAIDYIELGHDDDARAEVTEVLRINPQFTMEMLCYAPRTSPNGKVCVRFDADLRKAGLK
jgi:adenylate cyclase